MKSILPLLVLLCWVTSSYAQATKGIARVTDTPEPAESNARIALIIGNAEYESAPLKNPVNDAQSMSETLTNLGFQVDLLQDASQREMKRAIDRFGKKLQDGGLGLFYYSGHGMQVEGQNYLIPVNAQIGAEEDVEYEAVNVGRVLAKMDAARNNMNLVILDACRNNPYARSFRSASQGLATLNAPSGTFIAYATAPGSVASDGTGSNGLYTGELIKHMKSPGMKLEEVFKQVRASVQEKSNGAQVPWDASSLTGDFFFVEPQPEPAVLPVARVEAPPAAPEVAAPSRQYLPDEEAWELVKDSGNPDDLAFFIESFPQSTLVKVAELKKRMLERRRERQQQAAAPVEKPAPQEVTVAALGNDGQQQEMRKEFQEIQLGATKGRKERFVETYQAYAWAADEVAAIRNDLKKREAASVASENETRIQEMRDEFKQIQYGATKGRLKRFIGTYGPYAWASTEVQKVNRMLNVRSQQEAEDTSETEFDRSAMMSVYSRLNYQPTAGKYRDFLSKYEGAPEAEKQVKEVRELLASLEQRQSGQLSKFAEVKRLRALYERAEASSRETVGCGLFGIGCPDPLVFPPYQAGFHVKDYRRVRVNGTRSSWTDTGIQMDYGDVLIMVGSGRVKVCDNCSKVRDRGPQPLSNNWILTFRVGDEPRQRQTFWREEQNVYLARSTITEMGELSFLVRDWRTYPPPARFYNDNTGSFLLDVFVVEAKYEQDFKAFREALIAKNPEDEQIRAYLGQE